MELIFTDPSYDSEEKESGRFVRELKEALVEFDRNVEVIEADIGLGAAWPVALVIIPVNRLAYRSFNGWTIFTLFLQRAG